MRYHTLIINLSCHDIQANISSVTVDEQTPHLDTSNSSSAAIKTAISSAREISRLVRMFKVQYGLKYSHQFTMYAINVSLFCLLAQADFDFLDPDFLGLTEAFSTVACRSPVGRHLFHTFKLSVRMSVKAAQESSLKVVPHALKEFFEPREKDHEPDKWDRYAEGLSEAYSDGSFLEGLATDPIVPSLNDMLDWYERLSVGREINWERGKHQPVL